MAKKNYNKHAVLAYLFDMKTNCGTQHIGEDIDFTLREVGEGIRATGGTTPTSRSNFVFDLTRKRNTIAQRLPAHVIQYGYDLRKKTGPVPGGQSGDNYCGTFVYRGFDANGQTIPIQDWLEWGIPDREVTIVNKVPLLVQKFISNDEASLFSVIAYCDILSQILGQTVQRVQSPMKWQPNEIDGYYVAETSRNIYVYPLEAKAISTSDDINLVQLYGQYQTFITKYKRNDFNLVVRPIAAKMEPTGMLLAVLDHNPLYDAKRNKDAAMFNIIEIVRVRLDSPLAAWQKK